MFEKRSTRAYAQAQIRGAPEYPQLHGVATFYTVERGTLVITEVFNLPYTPGACNARVFALHIHEGKSCTGNAEDPFADAGGHYNPAGCEHPHHAGDLPPLFSNEGYAWSAVVTDRFTVQEVIGRTVIIHAGVDDFTTQPAGNAGARIACGIIR